MPNYIDPRFKVTITTSKDPKNPIESWLPEDLQFEIQSDWETPLAGGGLAELNAALSTVNLSSQNQWMTIAVWTGSSPISLSLPLQFIAENEGEAETKVLDPVRRLTKLALPSYATENNTWGVLHPPGPNPVGVQVNGILKNVELSVGSEDININIGKFLEFKRIIVQRVGVQFSTLLDRNGLPMRATVNLQFRSFNTPVKTDMNNIIRSRISNVGQP